MPARVLRGVAADAVVWSEVPGERSSDGAFHALEGHALVSASGTGPRRAEAPNPELEREFAAAAYQKGLREGAAAADQVRAQLEPVLARLARTIDDLAAGRENARHEADHDIVKLAVAVARRILHRELTVDPGALLGVVKAALEKVDARELHRVLVHPDDQAGVAAALAALGSPRRVEVAGEASLERGAVILEATRGTLDASIETQLQEIERGFADLFARRR
jgi:flagellar assembly protein FliH